MRDEDFLVVSLSPREQGILKILGEREIVTSVRFIDGADSTDNNWLVEELRLLYMKYYSRVSEYKDMEGK